MSLKMSCLKRLKKINKLIDPFVVIIPGAGLGSRFGSAMPKQYQKINGKLIIDYSLEFFLDFNECNKIILSIADLDKFSKKIKKDSRIDIIAGGSSRAESVKMGFDHILSKSNTENVLIHDAVRPCLKRTQFIDFMELFSSYKSTGMIYANRCTDTLKSSINGKTLDSTIDRSMLWQAQTPQVFKYDKLKMAYDLCIQDLNLLTDESSLFDQLDEDIRLFESSSSNIKITQKEDLKLAQYIIEKINN